MSNRIPGHGLKSLLSLLLLTASVVPAWAAPRTPADVVGCEVLVGDEGARVEVAARGDYTVRSFRVQDPPRFVLDVVGAVQQMGDTHRDGDGDRLLSVRTSQFARTPEPVTRIVLDLNGDVPVRVERGEAGVALVVGTPASRFDAAATRVSVDPQRPEGLPPVVYQPAPPLPGDALEVDHWQEAGGLGRISEPQRREEDGSYARTMSINMQNADIRTILRAIADFSGRNIIASPDVRGTVTVALSDVPWREALTVILRANGFDHVEEQGIIRVDTAEKLRDEKLAEKAAVQRVKELEPLVTRIVEIDYANAEEVKESVKVVLTTRGSVEVDTRTNNLIVKDIAENVDAVAELARQLDTRTPQVYIDALMVDIDSRKSRELGVKWGILNAAPSDVNVVGDLTVDREITESAGTLRVGTVFSWAEVQGKLQALQRDNLANIISNPRITTTDNREASILVGQKIPLITQDVAGNPVTRLETIGIRLVVTPHINSDKRITLDVHPEVSDLSSQATVQGGVIINTSEADTRVLVDNRETAVIGGLIRNVTSELSAGVPVLKDLPLVGGLFRTESKSSEQRELIVFLTPTIVDDKGIANDRHWKIRDEVKEYIDANRGEIVH